jgi:hypothetical protein
MALIMIFFDRISFDQFFLKGRAGDKHYTDVLQRNLNPNQLQQITVIHSIELIRTVEQHT